MLLGREAEPHLELLMLLGRKGIQRRVSRWRATEVAAADGKSRACRMAGVHGLGSSSPLHIRPPEKGKSHLELEEEDDDAREEEDNDDARDEEGGGNAT
jgi:hypothetical protein